MVQVVSLDVFDTALRRNLVSPDDVSLLSDRLSVEAVEEWVCRADPEIKALYEQTLLAGGRAVFVSDTDYPAGLLEKLLKNNGYASPVVYASSEHGVWKHNGLYEAMLRAENVAPEDVTHYGDNYQADYLAPRRLGIKAVHLPRPPMRMPKLRLDNRQRFLVSHMEALRYRSDYCESDYYYDVGYRVLGPLLVGFANWLDDAARRCGADKLWFCSSEGQIMRHVYRTVINDPLPTGYLFVSRRSMAVPILIGSDDPEDRDCLRSLVRVNSAAYAGVRAGEREDAQAYLERAGVYDGHAGVVDIGYSGTMQLAARHYGPGLPWFYAATYPGIRRLDRLGLEHHDYACHAGAPARTRRAFQDGTALLEPLLSATHGTVTGYRDGEPVFHEYAYEPFQTTAIRWARLGCQGYAAANARQPVTAPIPPAYACQPLIDLILHPTREDDNRNRRFRCYGSLDDNSRYENYRGPTPAWKRLLGTVKKIGGWLK
jgi:hypothetical protein